MEASLPRVWIRIFQAYERLLRIDQVDNRWDRIRARAVYTTALGFAFVQLLNLGTMTQIYGTWTVFHTLSVGATSLLVGCAHLLRWSRRFVFFAVFYLSVLSVGLVVTSTIGGDGINGSLLPFLAIGPLMAAFVAGWRTSALFTVMTFPMLSWLLYVSLADPLGTGTGPSGSDMSRFYQACFVAMLGGLMSAILSANTEAAVRSADAAARRARSAANRARHAERAKEAFLANMSHELRTPLNGVIGLTDAALTGPLPARERHLTETVKESAESLLVILNDLLDLSKINAGKLSVEPAPSDLRKSVDLIEMTWRETAVSKGLGLHVHVDPALPETVDIDELRVRQITNNLVSNAMKFTERGDVTITVRYIESRVELRIEDTGRGVSDDVKGSIFEAFEQGTRGTNRAFGGTGLGLPISRMLARMMGGDVVLEKTGDAGSTFLATFDAPLARSLAPRTPLPGAFATGKLAALDVLVAEDNRVNRMVIEEVLRGWGVNVTFAEDGEQCLEALKVKRFDMILLDRHMPGLDGDEVARRIRHADHDQAAIPIIAVTADAVTEARALLHAAGVDAVVTKPIRQHELAEAMLNAMARGNAEAAGAHAGEPPAAAGR